MQEMNDNEKPKNNKNNNKMITLIRKIQRIAKTVRRSPPHSQATASTADNYQSSSPTGFSPRIFSPVPEMKPSF